MKQEKASAESSRAVVNDMRAASTEVLLETARDVFLGKIGQTESTGDEIHKDGGVGTSVTDLMSESDRLPKFDPRELMIGRVVGRGAFCVVKDCNLNTSSGGSLGSGSSRGSFLAKLSGSAGKKSSRKQTLLNNMGNDYSGHRSISSERSASSLPGRFGRKPSGRIRYVMKQLSPELKQNDKINFLKGVVDLAMETRILASLDHPSIIKLEGVSSCDAFTDGYFIILEKVSETLAKRVKGWMDIDRQCKGITGVFTGSKKKVQRLQSDRITAAYDLAIGMNYLHQRKVVFRDLKPDNVGFDFVGVLKIFDFGLAKSLEEAVRTEDGLYKMTACTGAVRYMSPENMKGKPYGLSTDVYSWSMIMWYILALEPPFAMYTESMIIERACDRGYRPKIFSSWSSRLSKLITRSWSANPKERPSFATIANGLKDELKEVDPRLAQMVEESAEIDSPGIQE